MLTVIIVMMILAGSVLLIAVLGQRGKGHSDRPGDPGVSDSSVTIDSHHHHSTDCSHHSDSGGHDCGSSH